ncbi:MAG: hypothetical protein GY807_01895 [Gammaproteobacteria bacterium]|nr:hypothetical protein [Gammaproteobacteria bacterium]
MTKIEMSRLEELAIWHELERLLTIMSVDKPMSKDEVRRLLAQLPPRIDKETVGDRIRRMSQNSESRAVAFMPLADIDRMAADSSQEEIPLPDPGRALESNDGRFRLSITSKENKIHILIEALGFAADDFANKRIGLVGKGDWYPGSGGAVRLSRDDLVAIIKLDQDGDGEGLIDDRKELRQALLHPVIGVVEDG